MDVNDRKRIRESFIKHIGESTYSQFIYDLATEGRLKYRQEVLWTKFCSEQCFDISIDSAIINIFAQDVETYKAKRATDSFTALKDLFESPVLDSSVLIHIESLPVDWLPETKEEQTKYITLLASTYYKNRNEYAYTCAIDGCDYDSSINSSTKQRLLSIGRTNIELLTSRLDDENYNVVKSLTIILTIIGDLRAVEPLIKLLKGNSYEVREIAAEALGKLGDLRALSPLIHGFEEEVRMNNYYQAKTFTAALLQLVDKAACKMTTDQLDKIASLEDSYQFPCYLGEYGDYAYRTPISLHWVKEAAKNAIRGKCPKCGFMHGWDGKRCGHCGYSL
jgi:hypothetical protein